MTTSTAVNHEKEEGVDALTDFVAALDEAGAALVPPPPPPSVDRNVDVWWDIEDALHSWTQRLVDV